MINLCPLTFVFSPFFMSDDKKVSFIETENCVRCILMWVIVKTVMKYSKLISFSFHFAMLQLIELHLICKFHQYGVLHIRFTCKFFFLIFTKVDCSHLSYINWVNSILQHKDIIQKNNFSVLLNWNMEKKIRRQKAWFFLSWQKILNYLLLATLC